MKFHAIIVAGGRGVRMKSSIPKQFIELHGKPIIAHTIQRFLEYDSSIDIVVVLPSDQMETWDVIKKTHFPDLLIRTAIGGETRTNSVRSGLAQISGDGLVAIHDAVRPFVSSQTIADSFDSASKHGSGIAVVELKDSIRQVTDQGSQAHDRSDYRLVQTPQTFRVDEIKKAYQKISNNNYTDDASLFEAAGYSVNLVNGSYENLKITTQNDIK